MDAAAFLDELAPLHHHDRVRKMVDLGRRIAAEPAAAALVDSLAAHPNAYARLLALQSAYGSRDGARVLPALADRSALIRRRARRMVPVICNDAQAEAALATLPLGRALAGVCHNLRRRKRTPVVDAFLAGRLTEAPQRVDGKIVDLVAFGSSGAATRHAAALRDAGSLLSWTRLAAWQPEAVSQEVAALLGASETLDQRSRWRLDAMLPALASRAPGAALEVVRGYLRRTGDPTGPAVRAALEVLAARRPAETFDILREVHESSRPAHPPGAFGVVRFSTHTERLGVERIAYLMRLGGKPLPDRAKGMRWLMRFSPEDRQRILRAWLAEGRGSWGAFLLRFVPEEGELSALRERAFERWKQASQAHNGAIEVEHLAWLPRDLRAREARRHLSELQDLVTKPKVRIEYARLLPFEQAKEPLAPWLGHPEGEERALALRVWIGAVKLDRAALPAAVAAVKARKFEQDPVRLAMLGALGSLPFGAFAAAPLEAIGQCLQDALDAADLSAATSAAAEQLIVKLFRKDAAWGAGWLGKLLQVRGTLTAPGLGAGLTEAEVKTLAPTLAGLAQAWLTRERAGALLWLATSLGKRLPLVPDLVLALELCAQDLPFAGVAAGALELLRRHAGASFAALVPKLLAADKSFAILGAVARFVSYSRQDLLDPLLGEAPMTGRFATGRTAWVIDFGGGHARWTDRQQARHAAGLLAITRDKKREIPAVLSALETLVSLAFVDPAETIELASDARPPVRERAVRYLARIDGGEGVPVLVTCLGDDRARFAIYALRRAFAEMRPDEVLGVLQKAPMAKVTVAKEVLRLTGEVAGDEAFRVLLSFDRPDLHRDVRIALLRALWDHLDRPEAWAIFERAAADKDWVVVSRLADIPVGRLSAEAEARLARLLAAVLSRPEVEARIDLLRRIAYVPLRDGERTLFQACLLRMAGPHPEEAKVATAAALYRMVAAEADAVIGRMAELLPSRRLLLGFVEVVSARLGPHATAPLLRIAHGLLAALRADPRAVPPSLQLAARLLEWNELAELFLGLSQRDELHADAMSAALDALKPALHPELLEARLAEQSDPRLRRLALAALVHASGPGRGWSKERRKRLDGYRADPSPSVAGAAEFVFPPE